MTDERLREIAEVFAVALAERLGRSDEDLRALRAWYAMAEPPDDELLAIAAAANAFVSERYGGGTPPADVPWRDDLEALTWVITPIEVPIDPV